MVSAGRLAVASLGGVGVSNDWPGFGGGGLLACGPGSFGARRRGEVGWRAVVGTGRLRDDSVGWRVGWRGFGSGRFRYRVNGGVAGGCGAYAGGARPGFGGCGLFAGGSGSFCLGRSGKAGPRAGGGGVCGLAKRAVVRRRRGGLTSGGEVRLRTVDGRTDP